MYNSGSVQGLSLETVARDGNYKISNLKYINIVHTNGKYIFLLLFMHLRELVSSYVQQHKRQQRKSRISRYCNVKISRKAPPFNPLAPEFSLKFQHILYIKCEYYRNQKRQHYEINGIFKRKKGECVACLEYSVSIFVE